jgi:hypothetical protein
LLTTVVTNKAGDDLSTFSEGTVKSGSLVWFCFCSKCLHEVNRGVDPFISEVDEMSVDDLLAEFGGSEILGTHPGHEVEAVPRRVYLSVGLRDEFECDRCKENAPPKAATVAATPFWEAGSNRYERADD